MVELTPHQQLAESEKLLVDLFEKVEELKKQTRQEDLATAKRLIKTHGFTVTDLRPDLKTTRTTSATTKKAAAKTRSKRS